MAVTLVASVGGAPRAQCDYYLTGNAADASGDTVFGLGLMGGGTDVDAPGSRAIAIDRETAVLADDKGKATIVANSDHPTPYAYFIEGGSPEVVLPGTPLTYTNLRVLRAQPGSSFDIQAWRGRGLTSYTLNVENGIIASTQAGGAIY